MPRIGALRPGGSNPTSLRAIVNNPLTISYTDEPVGIRVRFARGAVPTADYLKVKDPTGNYVAFQWDPSIDPIYETSRGAWNDGSLREGTIWVIVPSMQPLEELVYAVEVYATAQGQSFTQAVTYTLVTTDDRFDTARVQIDFLSGKQYGIGRYRDKNAASENLFNGTQGTFTTFQTTAGTTRLSYTPTDVASNVRARRGTANFGYGVVFQEQQVDFTWTPETTAAVRERYRIWANGSVTRETYHYTTGAFGVSTAKKMTANIQPENTGMTGTYDAERVYKEFVWSNKRMINGVRSVQFIYPLATTETHASNFDGTTNNNQQIWGWQGTTTIPAGAFWYMLSFFDLAYAAGDGLNQWTRRMNPIYTWATPFTVSQLRAQFTSMAQDIIADWIPIAAADASNAYSGIEVLARVTQDALNGTNQRAACLAELQASGVSKGITLTSAASYVAAWTGGTGWEFLNKLGQGYPWLRKAYLAAGDTANAAIVESYIHAIADAAVQMEIDSGGGGQMKLDGPGADNYNAETSAMMILANSLEIQPNATRQATLNRLAARYQAGYFAQTKIPYSVAVPGTPNPCINAIRSTYYSYSGFEQWRANFAYPLPGGPQQMRQYVYEYTSPSGMEMTWQYQLQQTRRGLPGTLTDPMFCMSHGHASDWQWIVSELEYLYAKRRPGRWMQNQLEGLTGTDVVDLAAGTSVRPLCEVILKALVG